MSDIAKHLTAAIGHFAAAKTAHEDGDDAGHEAAVQNGMSAVLRALAAGGTTTLASLATLRSSGVRRSGTARDPKVVAEVRAALNIQAPPSIGRGAWTNDHGVSVLASSTPTEARARAQRTGRAA